MSYEEDKEKNEEMKLELDEKSTKGQKNQIHLKKKKNMNILK